MGQTESKLDWPATCGAPSMRAMATDDLKANSYQSNVARRCEISLE